MIPGEPASSLAPAEAPAHGGPHIRFSIVILTFARDAILADTLARVHAHAGERDDVEIILVDNNPEPGGRAAMIDAFRHRHYLWTGGNKGVVARNDGIDVARGDIVILLDDDVLIETPDFLDRFATQFDADARLGAVTVRKYVRGETRRRIDLIPHSDKDVDVDRPFRTFRFVGGCVGLRTAMLRTIGGFLPDFFYGSEEVDLSFRIVRSGWTILYTPDIVCEELEHPAGRKPNREAQTDRLYNRYIIAWLHTPFPQVLATFPGFTLYLAYRQRGEVRIGQAAFRFARWLGRRDRPRRDPLPPAARRYIKECGGAIWR